MKVYKWRKTDIDPIKLLGRVNAVKDNMALPSYVFISPKRIKEMRKFIRKQFKVEYPYSSPKQLDYNTELYMLNFSPCEVKGLPSEIVLVDDKSIREEGNRYESKER